MTDKTNDHANALEYLATLREKGYKRDFILKDGKLLCRDIDKAYSHRELLVDEYRRFEGMSNPADMSVVFAISCPDGEKGTVMTSYGPYADATLNKFMQDVKIRDK